MSTLGNNILMEYWRQTASPLPAGFRACEYLESTGRQWIDTGVMCKAKKTILEIKQSISENSPVEQWNGAQVIRWYIGFYSTSLGISIGDSIHYNLSKSREYWTFPFVVRVNSIAGTWQCNEYNGEIDNTGLDAIYSFSIAARNQTGNINGYIIGKTYFFRATVDGVNYNFLPALAISGTTYTDGNSGGQVTAAADKPGMYDTVSKRFFTNRGTVADFLYQLA